MTGFRIKKNYTTFEIPTFSTTTRTYIIDKITLAKFSQCVKYHAELPMFLLQRFDEIQC